jgi:peptidoglycan/xylan/chitin deacetylase (PgdA/CDA1 family)
VWEPGLYVSARRLERRLELLRRTDCTVLPLAEGIERLYRKDLPERAVALTFDDGYYDFGARAWPRLKAHGWPATVYLTTSRVDHNLPNVNLFVSYAMWKARRAVLNGDGISGLSGDYPLATSVQRQRVIDALSADLSTESASDKDAVAREIVGRLGLDYPSLLASRLLTLLRPSEVARLSQEGVDFQLHTHVHRTPADAGEFLRDVLVNRDRIQAMTGKLPVHLCYPSGNYRTAYLPALRANGVVSATTCDPDLAAATNDPLLLPRFIDTSYISDIVFESWLTGLAPRLPRRTRRGGNRFPLPSEPPRDVSQTVML